VPFVVREVNLRKRILAVLLAGWLAPCAAIGQVTCGTTIGKGETVTLTADVGPCDGDSSTTAALVVEGGRLDLGGHTVTCADTDLDGGVPQGIVVIGKKSRVMNGTIIGCMNCLAVGGVGRHRLAGLVVRDCAQDGVDVAEGSKNKLSDITASGCGEDGFHVRSDKHKLINAVATGNGGDGIDLTSSADKNKLTQCQSNANGDAGMEIGGGKNKVKDSTANMNVEDGVDFGGERNKLIRVVAQGNGAFDLRDCVGNKVKNGTFTTGTEDCL
jgi:hypothetical protein